MLTYLILINLFSHCLESRILSQKISHLYLLFSQGIEADSLSIGLYFPFCLTFRGYKKWSFLSSLCISRISAVICKELCPPFSSFLVVIVIPKANKGSCSGLCLPTSVSLRGHRSAFSRLSVQHTLAGKHRTSVQGGLTHLEPRPPPGIPWSHWVLTASHTPGFARGMVTGSKWGCRSHCCAGGLAVTAVLSQQKAFVDSERWKTVKHWEIHRLRVWLLAHCSWVAPNQVT